MLKKFTIHGNIPGLGSVLGRYSIYLLSQDCIDWTSLLWSYLKYLSFNTLEQGTRTNSKCGIYIRLCWLLTWGSSSHHPPGLKESYSEAWDLFTWFVATRLAFMIFGVICWALFNRLWVSYQIIVVFEWYLRGWCWCTKLRSFVL